MTGNEALSFLSINCNSDNLPLEDEAVETIDEILVVFNIIIKYNLIGREEALFVINECMKDNEKELMLSWLKKTYELTDAQKIASKELSEEWSNLFNRKE